MKILILVLFLGLTVRCQHSSQSSSSKEFGHVAIMQGATTETEAQFVVAVKKNEEVQVELLHFESRKPILKTIAQSIVWQHSDWKLVQFRFSSLQPNTQYGLKVSGYPGNWQDSRDFKTFGNLSELKIAVASCMKDNLEDLDSIWGVLKRQDPDLMLMIGDNSYTDMKIAGMIMKMTSNRLWDRHMETRNRLPIFRWKKLVPVFATWDDHDYGTNDGDKDFAIKEESGKIFSSFFPMSLAGKGFSKGPGVARQVLLKNHNFLMLDNRSFRSANKAKKGGHFGKTQRAWLIQHLAKGKLNWIVSGDQFFGGYHPYDSFQGQHPGKFKSFLNFIKKSNAKSLFISGDRHLSEIMKLPKSTLGYQSYEITSSPIHSSVYPGASYQYKNPIQIKKVDGNWNFVLFKASKNNTHYVLNTKSMGKSGQTFFTEKLEISHSNKR